MKRLALFGFGLGMLVASLAGQAHAQPYVPINNPVPVPYLLSVNPNDAIQDVPHGAPATNNYYVTPGQISGVTSYIYNVPLTGFALTFANNQDLFVLNPAGTLATGAFTFAPSPSDGQRESVVSTQAVTAATFTANTGQSVVGAPTALAAGVTVTFTYIALTATWYKS